MNCNRIFHIKKTDLITLLNINSILEREIKSESVQIWKGKHTFKPPGGRIKFKLLASIVVIMKPWNRSVFKRSAFLSDS